MQNKATLKNSKHASQHQYVHDWKHLKYRKHCVHSAAHKLKIRSSRLVLTTAGTDLWTPLTEQLCGGSKNSLASEQLKRPILSLWNSRESLIVSYCFSKSLWTTYLKAKYFPLFNWPTYCNSSSFPYSVQFQQYKDIDTFSACWVVWCFHNPSNSDRDYKIFNMSICAHAYTHGGPHFIVSSGLL